MADNVGKFFDSVSNFFSGGDQIPWCDRDLIAGIEKEVADAQNGSPDHVFKECLMRLSWALVHSRNPEDVQRGIAMLEEVMRDPTKAPPEAREPLYLLAVGYYRSGEHTRCRELVEQSLAIAPDWRQALNLKKMNEARIKRDGAIGIGIAATAVGLLAGGIAAAVARKK
ncbi:mitochondrial fission 1 protein A [Pyrus x bretschneideri]|uniref:mitochondrial fission 1 protein A n=1 Tax=Pyrus x bretschneideri TaxID=225117 RepID=UPI002030D806|nr:mitochondrial fission 1 protein A [Pyrus x bretschneideri]